MRLKLRDDFTPHMLLLFLLSLVSYCFGNSSLRIQAYKKANLIPASHVNVANETIERRLPKALIIGVRKCGTRALLEFLNLHPLIAAAPDEIHYFDGNDMFSQGIEAYRKMMPLSYNSQITIEKTPAYFSRSYVPARVKSSGIDLKFIVVFRDPVVRAISDYAQVKANRDIKNKTFLPFERVAFKKKSPIPSFPKVNTRYKAINISTYIYHIDNWLKEFPLEKFHFVDGGKLVKSPGKELRKVEKFLNLPHAIGSDLLYYNETRGFYCMKVPYLDNVINSSANEMGGEQKIGWRSKCLRSDKGRKHPIVAEPYLSHLYNYFRPLNEALFKVIEKRFDSWQH